MLSVREGCRKYLRRAWACIKAFFSVFFLLLLVIDGLMLWWTIERVLAAPLTVVTTHVDWPFMEITGSARRRVKMTLQEVHSCLRTCEGGWPRSDDCGFFGPRTIRMPSFPNKTVDNVTVGDANMTIEDAQRMQVVAQVQEVQERNTDQEEVQSDARIP